MSIRPRPRLTPPEGENLEDINIRVLPEEEVIERPKPEIIPQPIEEVVEQTKSVYSPTSIFKRKLVRKPSITDIYGSDYSPTFIHNPLQKLIDFITFKPSYIQNTDYVYSPDYSSVTDSTYAPYYASRQIYKPKTLQKRTLIYDPKRSADYDYTNDYYLQPLVVDELVPLPDTDVMKYAPESDVKISPETIFEVRLKPSPPQFVNVVYYKLMRGLLHG